MKIKWILATALLVSIQLASALPGKRGGPRRINPISVPLSPDSVLSVAQVPVESVKPPVQNPPPPVDIPKPEPFNTETLKTMFAMFTKMVELAQLARAEAASVPVPAPAPAPIPAPQPNPPASVESVVEAIENLVPPVAPLNESTSVPPQIQNKTQVAPIAPVAPVQPQNSSHEDPPPPKPVLIQIVNPAEVPAPLDETNATTVVQDVPKEVPAPVTSNSSDPVKVVIVHNHNHARPAPLENATVEAIAPVAPKPNVSVVIIPPPRENVTEVSVPAIQNGTVESIQNVTAQTAPVVLNTTNIGNVIPQSNETTTNTTSHIVSAPLNATIETNPIPITPNATIVQVASNETITQVVQDPPQNVTTVEDVSETPQNATAPIQVAPGVLPSSNGTDIIQPVVPQNATVLPQVAPEVVSKDNKTQIIPPVAPLNGTVLSAPVAPQNSSILSAPVAPLNNASILSPPAAPLDTASDLVEEDDVDPAEEELVEDPAEVKTVHNRRLREMMPDDGMDIEEMSEMDMSSMGGSGMNMGGMVMNGNMMGMRRKRDLEFVY